MCGSGASGRDGGFALTFWHHCLGLEGICGGAEALRLGHASVEAVTAIGRFCAEHDLDVEYRHDGWLWTATNTARRTDAHGRGAAPPRRAALRRPQRGGGRRWHRLGGAHRWRLRGDRGPSSDLGAIHQPTTSDQTTRRAA